MIEAPAEMFASTGNPHVFGLLFAITIAAALFIAGAVIIPTILHQTKGTSDHPGARERAAFIAVPIVAGLLVGGAGVQPAIKAANWTPPVTQAQKDEQAVEISRAFELEYGIGWDTYSELAAASSGNGVSWGDIQVWPDSSASLQILPTRETIRAVTNGVGDVTYTLEQAAAE